MRFTANGNYPFTAQYAGGGRFLGGTSTSVTVRV